MGLVFTITLVAAEALAVSTAMPIVARDLGGLRLAEQSAHLDRGRLTGDEVGHQPGQGQPGVDDVLDDEHVLAEDVAIEVFEDAHHTRGLGA